MKENNVQSVIDYLIDNGVSDFNTNLLIHLDIPALGEFRNIMDAARDGDWDLIWNVVQLYIDGDLS